MATLQSLINAAPTGGDVAVPAGLYDLADVAKTVHVKAATGAVVDAKQTAAKSGLRIHGAAPGASVQGLAVRNATAQNYAGVMVDGGASAPDVALDAVDAQVCCFGIRTYSSPRTKVTNFTAQHCAVGIGIWNVGGHTIDGFNIVDCDRMVVNDQTPGNDNGGNGFQLSGLQDGALTTIKNGFIGNARAASIDYLVDGGGIELFAAADVLISGVEVHNSVNAAETGTNPGKGDCARIHFVGCNFVGREGSEHTENASITCNGIIARNLVDSLIENCIFDRLDHWCLDFTQSSKYSGSGTRNVTVRGCQFFLRDGVDRMYSFGPALPVGMASAGNTIVAPPTATLAVLNGAEYPATQAGFSAWQTVTGLEAGSKLYTPQQWADLSNPLPDPDTLIANAQGSLDALSAAYREAYRRAQ